MSLPPGLYEVTALLPGGQPYSEVVTVSVAKETLLELRRRTAEEQSDGMTWATVDAELAQATKNDLLDSAASQLEFQSASGCELVGIDGGVWRFRPLPNLTNVPVAVFRDLNSGTTIRVSIPVNPMGPYPENGAAVSAVRSPERTPGGRGGLRLVTSFARQRRVASVVEGAVRNNLVTNRSAIIDDAARLLQDKYSDPTGAVLGALTLHRVGRLKEREAWIENLARDFPWLPDGRILLEALAKSNRSPSPELLHASLTHGRVLFTDAFSLLLELLKGSEEARAGYMAWELAKLVDWDALTLTTRDNGTWD
jgi:hypothetical protein